MGSVHRERMFCLITRNKRVGIELRRFTAMILMSGKNASTVEETENFLIALGLTDLFQGTHF